jgi:hypothetical protein
VGGFPGRPNPERLRACETWRELAQVFHLRDGANCNLDATSVARRSVVHVEDVAKMSEVYHTATATGAYGWRQKMWFPQSNYSNPVLSDDFRPFFARLRRVWKP